MTSESTCHRCTTKLRPGDRFCPSCGTGTGGAASTDQGHQNQPAETWGNIFERISRAATPRYRVVRLLGYGGFAGVYLAEEPRLGRRVAIKVMSPALMMDAGLVSRFIQEARTTAQLNHPNIVTIYDVDEREGLHYFAMAYVAGRTLASIMSAHSDPIPLRAVLHWLHNIGSALAYAHRAGVIHRDVKPSNIMVDANGDALVTDFGIAKVTDEPSLTRTGILVGTPTYMSPEQCLSGVISGASDQYSLGVVGYELLAGQPPFRGATLAVLHAHTHQAPPPLETLRADCPPHVAGAIMRMLSKEPADRFPSVGAALNALDAAPLPHEDPIRELAGVLGASVEGLSLTPPPVAVQSRDTFQLAAVAHDAVGRPLRGRKVRWVSENPSVAVVTEEGAVQALTSGTTRILAVCEGIVESVPLVVADAPFAASPQPLGPAAPPWRTPVPEPSFPRERSWPPPRPEEPPSAPTETMWSTVGSASGGVTPDAAEGSHRDYALERADGDEADAPPGFAARVARPRVLFGGLVVGVVTLMTAVYLLSSPSRFESTPSDGPAVPIGPPPPPPTLSTQVRVRQLPSGAQLTLDGIAVRDTVLEVAPGFDHVLVARAAGFFPDTHVVRLEQGERESWRPVLRPRAEPPPPVAGGPDRPNTPGRGERPSPSPTGGAASGETPPPAPPDTTRAVEPPGVPANPAEQMAQFEGERERLLDAFAAALEAANADAVRSVYTGFTGDERWWQIVTSTSARPLDVILSQRGAAQCCAGDSAHIQYGVGLAAGGSPVPLPMQRFIFRRDAQGRWRIARIY